MTLHDAVILLLTAFQGFETEHEDRVTELIKRNNQLLEEKRQLEATLEDLRSYANRLYYPQEK